MTPSDYETRLRKIEGLMAKNERTPAENDQLSALADAAGQYEDKHFPIQPLLVRESDRELFSFYQVGTLYDLIDAMDKHILMLQEKLRCNTTQNQSFYFKAREG